MGSRRWWNIFSHISSPIFNFKIGNRTTFIYILSVCWQSTVVELSTSDSKVKGSNLATRRSASDRWKEFVVKKAFCHFGQENNNTLNDRY